MGKIHLRLLKEIETIELVGIHDSNPEYLDEIAKEYEVKAFHDLDELIDQVDAVDIVTPTLSHFDLAKAALRKFKHIFIEKPVTHTVEEAKSLLKLVNEAGVKAQVGHVERFNPAFLSIKDHELRPMFIESHRLAQWNPRGTDVSVILDLMIHDLDVILSIVKSPVKKISASGVAVISETPDIANARLEFNNGAVANLTASRISMKNMRKMRIFQPNAYLSIDFLEKKSEIFRISEDDSAPVDLSKMRFEFKTGETTKYLTFEKPPVEAVNSIKMELEEFARAIKEDAATAVTLEEATAALETAYQIIEKINSLCIA